MADLAMLFGVTEISIKRKLHRLGLRIKTRWTRNKSGCVSIKDQQCNYRKSQENIRQRVNEHKARLSAIEREQAVLRQYSLGGVYTVGDKIFHPILQDTGEVIAKGFSTTGIPIIIVKFKNSGIRKLVENTVAD